MGIGLNENDAGHDREIWYHNLISCLSFTIVLDDGTLLGTHMTVLTTRRKLELIIEYFQEERGDANILCMLLIGNIGRWATHAEEDLRTGGNLRATLRELMGVGVDCTIYQYDSMASDAGGMGAAAHLIHKGGAYPYPYVDIVKDGDWSHFMNIRASHPARPRLKAKSVYGAVRRGESRGMRQTRFVPMIRAIGPKTAIAEGDMLRT
ncbi:hypothetical protein [Pelagibius sp. Alg239-R121]|uniref:hypothetical protein n=1 Tax=Pelagibius sp. Alg239-R121 TaxID=2993448 RepID=UPI0024A76CDF|nr:hypothetical protein [Pelagibius sp. Alg239-R121]